MIAGKLVFSDPDSITDVCKVRVVVEDTGRADASSTVVAEQTVTVDPTTLGHGVPFAFPDEAARPGLIIRAHLSRDETPDVQLGDHISMAAHPADEADVEVVLKEVS